jgi:hypothetical protein
MGSKVVLAARTLPSAWPVSACVVPIETAAAADVLPLTVSVVGGGVGAAETPALSGAEFVLA